jgi:phosphoglycolate phosphatase-like HAD superfamily hydrolase
VPRPYVVIDLDGVLADVGHRLHHLEGRPKDWAAFFAGLDDDPLLPEGLAVARRLSEEHRVVYLSGRPERTRARTQAWLERHGVPRGRLLLRGDHDRRPARVLKVGVLRRLAAGAEVAVLVDDDPQVCAAARAAGFAVLEATWARPQPTLLEAQEGDAAGDART